MRHLAWLHARPGKRKSSRQDLYKAKDENHPYLDLPEIDPCGHIVDYLFEVGPGTGEHKVEWAQVDAWCRRTGVDLSEFEAVMVVELSGVYLGQLHDAREEACPPPYLALERQTQPATRSSIATGLRAALAAAGKAATEKQGKAKK